MADMLERPTISSENDGNITDLEEDRALTDLLASLAEDKVSFGDIPYARPYSHHEEPMKLAAKKVLTRGDEAGTPLSNFRSHLSRELQGLGHDKEAAEDATVILSELVGNVRLHGAVPSERYSGECRVHVLKHEAEDDLGRAVMRVTTVIEALSYSDIPASSEQERQRREFEGGNGLDLVKQLTEAHQGNVGKYRVIKDARGHETFVPEEAGCGNFIVWAALRADLLVDSAATETE